MTAVLVVGLCAFAISRGWSIVHFAATRAQSPAHQVAADAIGSWARTPGLTGAALQATLNQTAAAADRDALRRRSDNLAALLSVQPFSSTDWLSLAGMRLVTGQPAEEVFAAMAMSSLTGPNEGAVMVQRAIFGLLQWEALPPEARRGTIRDLAGAAHDEVIRAGALTVTRNVLRAKSVEARSQIAALLRADRVSDAELGRLGL